MSAVSEGMLAPPRSAHRVVPHTLEQSAAALCAREPGAPCGRAAAGALPPLRCATPGAGEGRSQPHSTLTRTRTAGSKLSYIGGEGVEGGQGEADYLYGERPFRPSRLACRGKGQLCVC